ncbi:hypothetical protein [Flavobacterium flavigenum]|uniref:hypothetical protein n=1 Tax=Flavobacterium flavigenum TaxID=3003258 RepID=UPI0022AC86AC|nr:hypothetical protein [Flavobacterium flavigenum]
MFINYIIKTILFTIFFPIFVNGQNFKILNDSILIDNSYLKLEELKIISKNEVIRTKIYKIIQSTYDIFDGLYFDTPEERIKIKKDTLSKRILENRLRESNSGFEHYEIYYDKNNIINLSISIQSYGSPWEGIKYYCFDLNTGKRIGLDLFLKQDKLLKEIRNILKNQGTKIYVKRNDLLNFKILVDKSKQVRGIDFSIFDTENHRNGGYEEFIVHFDRIEIKEYLSFIYKKRF